MLKADGIFWKLRQLLTSGDYAFVFQCWSSAMGMREMCVMVEVGAERKVTLLPVSQTQRADSPVPRKWGPQLGK